MSLVTRILIDFLHMFWSLSWVAKSAIILAICVAIFLLWWRDVLSDRKQKNSLNDKQDKKLEYVWVDSKNKNTIRNYKKPFIISVFIFVCGAGIAWYIAFYESPEECFVREMRKWGTENGLMEEMESITQDNAKMAVARAKNILKEYNAKDIKDSDSRKIFIQTGP